MNKNKVLYIVPVDSINLKTELGYLENCVDSIKNQDIDKNIVSYDHVLVCNDEKTYDTLKKLGYNIIKNPDGSSYQSNVNFAAKESDCDYFSVVEFDDTINSKHLHSFVKYSEKYKSDFYLPMIVQSSVKGKMLGISNELTWTLQFVRDWNSLGYLNENTINEYNDFRLSGSFISKKSFIAIGGYKNNIKLTFMFELLLRALRENLKVFTIPRVTYVHISDREGSLFHTQYMNEMDAAERKFWFDTAKSESYYNVDRWINTSSIDK